MVYQNPEQALCPGKCCNRMRAIWCPDKIGITQRKIKFAACSTVCEFQTNYKQKRLIHPFYAPQKVQKGQYDLHRAALTIIQLYQLIFVQNILCRFIQPAEVTNTIAKYFSLIMCLNSSARMEHGCNITSSKAQFLWHKTVPKLAMR